MGPGFLAQGSQEVLAKDDHPGNDTNSPEQSVFPQKPLYPPLHVAEAFGSKLRCDTWETEVHSGRPLCEDKEVSPPGRANSSFVTKAVSSPSFSHRTSLAGEVLVCFQTCLKHDCCSQFSETGIKFACNGTQMYPNVMLVVLSEHSWACLVHVEGCMHLKTPRLLILVVF